MEAKTLREIFDLYLACREVGGKVITKATFLPVKSIIYYIENKKNTAYLTQSLFDEWKNERKRQYSKMCVVSNFLFFANERGYLDIKCPRPVRCRKKKKTRLFDLPLAKSVISDMMTKFINWREKTSPLNNNYKYLLLRFNSYCKRNWPNAKELTNEMIDGWCQMNNHESAVTRNSRVFPIILFLDYAIAHGWKNITKPKSLPVIIKKGQTSHIFTQEELKKFFEICDNTEKYQRESVSEYRRRSLVMSVVFRFLYSTGMRLVDCVTLKRTDVNLQNGIVTFSTFNGRHQHSIAIHQSLMDLLTRYDHAMDSVMPDRKAFFPNRDKKNLTPSALERQFVRLWSKVSDTLARVRDFRVTYAVDNINSWDDDGMDWTIDLLHLSRAMGHTEMKTTQHYMALIPRFQKVLAQLSGKNLNNMLTNLNTFLDNEKENKQ